VDKLRDLLDTVERYGISAQTQPTRSILDRWIEERSIESDEALSRLLRVADQFTSVPDLLEQLPLYADGDHERVGTGGSSTEAVSLMTLHAAKGLEFPVVFIAGAEDGLIPYRQKDSDLSEERRLFYVGMTRAQDELVLLAARTRMWYGQRMEYPISPFVGEIPEHLLKRERPEPTRKKKSKEEQLSLW
jgi:superfamily I DNA/RNA helicase